MAAALGPLADTDVVTNPRCSVWTPHELRLKCPPTARQKRRVWRFPTGKTSFYLYYLCLFRTSVLFCVCVCVYVCAILVLLIIIKMLWEKDHFSSSSSSSSLTVSIIISGSDLDYSGLPHVQSGGRNFWSGSVPCSFVKRWGTSALSHYIKSVRFH